LLAVCPAPEQSGSLNHTYEKIRLILYHRSRSSQLGCFLRAKERRSDLDFDDRSIDFDEEEIHDRGHDRHVDQEEVHDGRNVGLTFA
jgi:hypothetical protein